jgi:hypothetical protein
MLVEFAISHSLSNHQIFINHDLVSKITQLIRGDVNAKPVNDSYFYLDIV